MVGVLTALTMHRPDTAPTASLHSAQPGGVPSVAATEDQGFVGLPDKATNTPAPSHLEVPAVAVGDVQLILEVNENHSGYRVQGNAADGRFTDGDLIVSINGRPVEPTAAGSELLLAAIMNPRSLLVVER